MLRTAQSVPLKGFRRWASTPDVSLRRRQPATGPPGSYPDRTHTGRRRRADEHEDQLHEITASPPVLLDALQAEYSRNLLFTVGAQMDQVFDRVVDRTRSRLDVPTLRTLFGAKQRPGRNGTPDLSLKLAAVIETPRYDLTLFKVHFGNLTLKAYTKDLDASGAALAGR